MTRYRINDTEITDLTLTQSIDRYLEMEPEEAYASMTDEWPEQIATLLAVFCAIAKFNNRGRYSRVAYLRRTNGHSTYIVIFPTL